MRLNRYALVVTLLLTAGSGIVGRQTPIPSGSFVELQSPLWTRFVEDTYDLALKHLRNNDRNSTLNLINRQPLVARFVLIRLLRSEDTRPLGLRFAEGFTSNSASEIEVPLAGIYGRLSPVERDETSDWMEGVSRVLLMSMLSSQVPGRGAQFLHDLERARAFFKSEGFVDGEAYCLRMIGDQNLRLFQDASLAGAVDAYRQALALYETTQNTRGQALALISLGRVIFRSDPQKQVEYWAQATEKLQRNEDAFLLYSNLVSEANRLKPILNSQPGLHLHRTLNYLNSFDPKDPKELQNAMDVVAREPDPVIAARAGNQLSQRLHSFGPEYHEQAVVLFDRALHIAEELKYPGFAIGVSTMYPAETVLLEGRAITARTASHYPEAESSFLAALDSLERPGLQNDYFDEYRQNLLNNLGALYARLGDFPKSLEKLADALSIAERINPSGAGSSRPLRSLALVQAQLGELRLAEDLLRKGSRIQGQGTINTSLLALAEIHVQFGRYADAITDLEDMAPEFKGWIDDGVHTGEYGSRTRLLALAWLRIGDLQKAAEYAKVFEEGFGTVPYDLPGSVWLTERGLTGLVLIEAKKYSEAERYFAGRLTQAAGFSSLRNGEEANALKGLARVYRLQGRKAQAVDSATKALAKYRTLLQGRDELEMHVELGLLALDSQESGSAREHFTEALRLAETSQSPQGVWTAQSGMAAAARREGNIPEAIEHLVAAAGAVEAVSSRLSFDLIKSTFIEDRIEIYDDLIRLLVSMGRNEKALEYAQRRRAQSFAQEMQMQGGVPAASSDSALVKQMKDVQSRLIGKQKALGEQMSDQTKTPEIVHQLERDVAVIRSEHADMLRRLEQESPIDALRQGFVQPLTISEIQHDVLKQSDALVDYVVTNKEVFAFVISRSQFKVVTLKINRNALADKVENLKKPFDRFRNGSTDLFHMDKYDVNLAHQIYCDVVEPLGVTVQDAGRLILIPDDILNYLPFESLVASKPEVHPAAPSIKYGEYRNVDWLVKTHSVVYAIATETLRSNFGTAASASKTLLSIGNPKLGADQLKNAAMPRLGSLPHSENEARSVAGIFQRNGIEPRVLVGKAAQETAFSQGAPKAGYIHFAGHAVLDERQPYYSALMLAPDEQNDGWLQTYEIMKMRLSARLVTLSGCDTGLGRLYKGEGVLGLRRAFLLAGAQSVTVSLWSVEDSVSGFMEAFYTNINKGQPAETALSNAKLQSLGQTMRLNGMEFSLSHPFFWAPFTLASTSIR